VIPAGGASGSPPALATANVAGSWCFPVGPGCEQTLGGELPSRYRSFAWSGAEAGTRIITGLRHNAMLELAGSDFTYQIGAGGEIGNAQGGAAFSPPGTGTPAEGWIADDADPTAGADGAGQSQVIHMIPLLLLRSSPQLAEDQLGEEAVPFRRPLYALVQAPGTSPGDPNAPALAVGELGQIARYTPGQGWRPEALYNSAGEVQSPTLRGVAWPEPARAYAVGDEGAMWLWRAETGLWEPDPAKPVNFIGNLQAIAFSPSEPSLGYAVGRQGVLLKYGKSWEQAPLPPELKEVNFTSIAFAGNEALATYRTLALAPGNDALNERFETGGVAIEDGSGWHVDPGVNALLAQLPEHNRVLSKVAALPDGGAVVAGPGKVIEREAAAPDSPTEGWHFSSQPLPEAQNISALAAYREPAGALRAIVSVDLDRDVNPEAFINDLEEFPFKVDVPRPTAPGHPPAFLGPDLLPDSGYLLRETASGWSDMEHQALPAGSPGDMPVRPDPVLALLVNSSGSTGLAVGGQTGDLEGKGLSQAFANVHYQTAAALRFPAGAASPNGTAPAPIATQPGTASFVVGGQAACAQAECSDQSNEGLGPDTWLTHALQTANGIATGSAAGLRGFLYTGGRSAALPLPCSTDATGPACSEAFERELTRYAQLLGSGGSLPVYSAASEDLTSTSAGIESFAREPLGSFFPGAPAGHAYYAVPSTGASGGEVLVIVLSFAAGNLEAGEEAWLEKELKSAREAQDGTGIPAIVMSNDSLDFALPVPDAGSAERVVNQAKDASAVAAILTNPRAPASAYFFDYPGANVKTVVSYGTRNIPAYGTGTLGYVRPEGQSEGDSLGSSGFLLVEVLTGKTVEANRAEVRVKVVPNIGQLALDATDGVLLRRSQVGLFEALARRPSAGIAINGSGLTGNELFGPDLYDKIPFDCQGPNCADEVAIEYTFTSSNPEIASFVEHESAQNVPHEVKLGANKLPVPDEPRNAKGELNAGDHFAENNQGEEINERGEVVSREQSGLLCAYNEGTTTVSITTGGLTYSEPVRIQGGSVQYPCGTVPLKNPPSLAVPGQVAFTAPALAPAGSPPASPQVAPAPLPAPPPVILAPVPPKLPVAHRPPAAPAPFFAPQLLPAGVLAIVPPLSAAVARPTPPSGTAQVFEPMAVGQREREDESAEETASLFAAYHPDEGAGPGPGLMLALLVIAAGAGVGILRGGPGRSSWRRSRHAFARARAREAPQSSGGRRR
jgi:hypothetical protein